MSSTPDKRTRDILKEYFETGDRPKEIEFSRLIDSGINQKDDKLFAEDGKIGIGTDQPERKLHVEGDAKIANNAIVNGHLGVQTENPIAEMQVGEGIKKVGLGSVYDPAMGWGSSYIGFNAVRIPNTPSSKNWFIASDGANNGAAAIYSNVGGDLYFATIPRDADNNAAKLDKSLTDIQFLDTRKVVISSKGNVGIGEMNPQNKLEIKGVADTGLRLPTGKGAGKILTSDVDGNAVWRPATDVTDNLWRTLSNPNNIGNGNSGNVGIGVVNPTEKLEVNGSLQLEGNLYGQKNGNDFVIASVKNGGGAYMHLRTADYVGNNQGGMVFVSHKGPNANNGFVFLNRNPGENPEWQQCLSIDSNKNTYLHNNKIYLRTEGDKNHGLGWLNQDKFDNQPDRFGNIPQTTIDGPFIFGYQGGALGTTNALGEQKMALQWKNDKSINLNGKLTAKNTPLFVKKYYLFRNIDTVDQSGSVNSSNNKYIIIDYPPSDYEAMVGSFSFNHFEPGTAGAGQVNVWIEPDGSNNQWKLEVRFPNSHNSEKMALIFFIRRELF